MWLYDSFSVPHSLAYSFVGIQTIILSTSWSPIYWNTACLIVNSGGLEDEEIIEEVVSIYETEEEEEDEECEYEDLPDRSGKKKKQKATKYGKIATAIGKMASAGILVSPPDINKSGYTFSPDKEGNSIRYGLKGINKVSKEFSYVAFIAHTLQLVITVKKYVYTVLLSFFC